MDRSHFVVEWFQHRNNTVGVTGFSCPNPIPRPFDTETDSDPAPDLSMPLNLKTWIRGIGPTHSRGQVEKATSPSARGSPDPDGRAWLGMRG